MRARSANSERGVALFFALFSLLMISALAATLVMLTSTETSINSNYRSEGMAFFGAKAGIDEVMDRMMPSTTQTPAITLPTVVPSATGGVVYLINAGNLGATAVQPWNYSNAYADDEFCHDYTISGMQAAPPDIPCTGSTSLPSGSSWYTTIASNAPWNGTAAALPYRWVRITEKVNGSETYLAGGTTPTVATYSVNSSQAATSQVCWNGTSEMVLPSGYANCAAYTGYMQVYLLTSFATSSTGARKLVQADVSLTPIPTLVYGLFATSTQCSSLSLTGNGNTDSYTTANGGTYAATHSQTYGDVGTNGSVTLTGNATIGGSVGVQNPTTGSCVAGSNGTSHDLSTTGSAGIYQDAGHLNQLTCLQASPGAACATGPLTFTPPTAPNPLPPTSSLSYSGNTAASLVPGSYGNISLSGNSTLTLAPGVYKINSISLSGNSVVSISPAGQVVLNVAGTSNASPVTLSGNANNGGTPIPSNFLINYAGTGSITVTGNGSIDTLINAPNAAISFTGNGSIYGAVIGNTLSYTGNAAFHFDRNIQQTNSSSSTYFTRIGYRELPY